MQHLLDKSTSQAAARPQRKFNIGLVAIVLWGGLAAVLAYRQWVAPLLSGSTVPPVTVSGSPAAAAAGGALIAERLTDLSVTPKTVLMPTDLALDAAVAIKKGEYTRASQIANDVLARSTIQGWRFYPFNDFIGGIVGGEDQGLLKSLNAWAELEPNSAMAHLVRAEYYKKAAWRARYGGGRVPEPLRQIFDEDMDYAVGDLQASIKLNPRIPLSHYELLDATESTGNDQQVEQVFQAAIAAFPTYYNLYRLRLSSLPIGTAGSISALYAFVDRYAGTAADNSPFKMLYLDLYAKLLETAGVRCRSSGVREQCVKNFIENTVQPALTDGMSKALNLYTVSDPIQFSAALWPLLETMSCGPCVGSPGAVGGVLQMAANVMGSDNRMMDEPTHNSYVLDDITARVWVQMGNPSNADTKFREALRDVEHTSFPDGVQKAEALAGVFEDMEDVAYDAQQFIDMIVYHEAGNAVAGANRRTKRPWIKCYALYRLKQFQQAVQECTALIDGNGDYLESHYYRGKAYELLRQWDASIADFAPIADSAHNYYRVGAALDMSYDYGQKGDYAGQLTSMNAHPYLFDASMQEPHDLAVAHNNRCFAEMKLGELQKALDDCTTSLQYDRIPDAFQKQQELLKILGKTST
jgi:hypothetical protein